MADTTLEEFKGTDRFTIRRRLGAGAFGVVYEAHDLQRDSVVALKLLRRKEPRALYRFKQEFRALADVNHPNLVTLYELLSDSDRWFFTMQLVEGVGFLDYVWREAHRAEPASGSLPSGAGLEPTDADLYTTMETAQLSHTPTTHAGRRPAALRVVVDYERLRASLAQLVDGIAALHRAGKLHRDIKPSNVLVKPDGRLVILDFGLVHELAAGDGYGDDVVAGTPPYMSPEQILGGAVHEASDWYNLGAMLYEALSGRRAFSGTTEEIIRDKCRADPAPPSDIADDIPPDLDALCRDLLKRDADARPSGEQIRRRLTRAEDGRPASEVSSVSSGEALLVGREGQIAALLSAFDRVREARRPVTVYVRGSSGMGKTALVRQALDELRAREGGKAVFLAGRCYERESVPFKALDSLVDVLSRHLEAQPPEAVAALLPEDIRAIVRLFPVLSRVEAVEAAERDVLQILDSRELRRRAFAAFRELLARLSRHQTLVLFIDDLQWGDIDSAALLAEIFRPPEPPALLFIGCYRSEEAETSPMLRTLLPLAASPAWGAEVREVGTSDLTPAEAQELARSLLGRSMPDADAKAAEIARDSRGSPYLVDELVRFAKTRDAGIQLPATLDDVIHARIGLLPEGPRRLLELLAVSGRPLPVSIVKRAAAVEKEEHETLAALRGARLIRTRRGEDDRDEVEAYHDRIRETVVARLSPDALSAHHRRLARTLEAWERVDAETLAIHFQGAGENDRAAEYAERAGSEASRVLAFDRAARLYQQALTLQAGHASGRHPLRVKLGDALANAGRGPEAADVYLAAVPGAGTAEAVELMRRASQQLLISGHVERGLEVLRDVLANVGIRPATAPWRVILSILYWRLRLMVRGLSFREREAGKVPVPLALRIDTCWAAAEGLGLVDTIRGAEFQARHVFLALEEGEPYRVARALAMEVPYTATAGVSARRRTAELLEAASATAARVRQPFTDGLVTFARGAAAYLEGDFRGSLVHCEEAEKILRDRCAGAVWALGTTRIFVLRGLVYLGQLNELSARLASLMAQAQERGERLTAMFLQTNIAYLDHLRADRPEEAARTIAAALEQWPRRRFDLPHFWALHSFVDTYLYAGDGARAWALVQAQWSSLVRSLHLRTQIVSVEAFDFRARSALAAARDPGLSSRQRERYLSAAVADARRIERLGAAWAVPFARAIRGGVAAFRGRTADALAYIAAAEQDFERQGMALHVAACRRRGGELAGGAEGKARVEAADAWMQGQQVKDPVRMTAMLAPGR